MWMCAWSDPLGVLGTGVGTLVIFLGSLSLLCCAQIDETLLNRKKKAAAPFCRQRRPVKQRWLWGAATADGLRGGQVAFVLLLECGKPRGAAALRAALLATIAPGSLVIHDDWGAYRAIDWSTLPFEHSPRSVVNHSKEIRTSVF